MIEPLLGFSVFVTIGFLAYCIFLFCVTSEEEAKILSRKPKIMYRVGFGGLILAAVTVIILLSIVIGNFITGG